MNRIELDRATKVYRVYQGSRGILKELLLRRRYHRPFWALKEVSLQLPAGAACGVIGNNGAGKSTLLKLIAGTTSATSGTVSVLGRTASLLELGAGFHAEFTGRENIYFTAATLGISRQEAEAQCDEIIGFAELAEFIDQPVKTYSSGMYLRLGFAVATAFDPDVLVIDEALAVGDQGFQKKCIDRIHRFKDAGKNILFCSHNMYQVQHLCDVALWLHRGEARAFGESREVVGKYSDFQRNEEEKVPVQARPSSIESATLTDLEGREQDRFETGGSMRLSIKARFTPEIAPNLGVGITRNDGTVCYCTNTVNDKATLRQGGDGSFHIAIEFTDLALLSGKYHFSIATTDERSLHAYDIVESICPFEVRHTGSDYGLIRMGHRWS